MDGEERTTDDNLDPSKRTPKESRGENRQPLTRARRRQEGERGCIRQAMKELIRYARECPPQEFDPGVPKQEEPTPQSEHTNSQSASQVSTLQAIRQSLETLGRLGKLREEEFELPEGLRTERLPSSQKQNFLRPLVEAAKKAPPKEFSLPSNLRRKPNKTGTKPNKTGTKKMKTVTIIQLNANGIGAGEKRAEILKYAEEKKADVLCLQETNLRKGQDTPAFEGWEVAGRADRRTHRGTHEGQKHGYGGVLTLVRKGALFGFEPTDYDIQDRNSDAVRTVLYTTERNITILNAYVATIKTGTEDSRRDEFQPHNLPHEKDVIIAADLNAHHDLWDDNRETDQRGTKIAEWMDLHDMVALNSGEPTRHDASGRGTAPDVTICHASMAGRTEWRVGADLASDHRPIIIEVNVRGKNEDGQKRRATRNLRKTDWTQFRQVTDKKLEKKIRGIKSIETASKRLAKILVQAAENASPLAPPRKNAKVWWCPEAEEAVKERREAREALKRDPGNEELMGLCALKSRQAKDTVKRAKLKTWAKHCEEMETATDSRRLYATIKKMSGQSKSQGSAAALRNENKLAKSNKEKANMLAKQYAKVSESNFSKTPRELKRRMRTRRMMVKQALGTKCAEHRNCKGKVCRRYSMTELEAALSQMKNGAPGPDGVTPQMLKELSTKGKKILLRVLNYSLATGQVPTAWRRANIVPIQKNGKPPERPTSYRPISLTSCVCKVAERMLQGRLAYLLEANGTLAPEQAGFRTGRCTEEQIAKLGQDILDALEAKPMKRTIMVAVDMTAAYDRVHKDSLLYKMTEMGIPPCMIKWIKGYLADRRARVIWDGTHSNETKMREGLPQGGVLSPILWLCYSNDLAPILRQHEVDVGMYADDVVIYASDRDVSAAQGKVQRAVSELDKWAHTWNMKISREKTKSILFSSNMYEVNSKKKVDVFLGDTRVEQVSEVAVLGVIFDTQMTFGEHVKKTKQKLTKRLQTVKALAGTSWGCHSQTLRKMYCQFIQPVALYGSSTYMTSSKPSTQEKIDQVAAAGARIITGCPAGTRNRVVMAEANIRSIPSLAEQQGAVLRERILRLPEEVPARQTLSREVKKRLQRKTWRDEAKKVASEARLEDLDREGTTLASNPPWLMGKGRVSFHTETGENTRKSDAPEKRKAAAARAVEGLKRPNSSYFTDGSTEEGFGKGGGGIVRKEEIRGNKVWSIPAGRWTSSYRAEQVAFLAAVKDATTAPREVKTIRLSTDSLSLVMFLRTGPARAAPETLTEIWNGLSRLAKQGRDVQVVWIPGHADIEDNEEADKAANTGRTMGQENTKIDLPSARVAIRCVSQRKWSGTYHTTVPPEHTHRRATDGRSLRYESGWNRHEQVLLHQLRANRCPLLQATLAKWGRPGTDGLCEECGVPEDTEHYICECPKYQAARSAYLGHTPTLTVLQENPGAVLRFLRRTGLLKKEAR